MDKKLEGKTAIITGADSALGQATALEFARHGANVVVNYLYNEDGAQLAFHQVQQQGRKALVVQADISSEEQVEALFDGAISQLGELHILVNIVGMGASGTKVAELSTERWRDAFLTNVDSYFFCARRFVNHRLSKGGKGKIVNITPAQQRSTRIGAADYVCTKEATISLTRTLALEVAEHGICVNNLSPGVVEFTPYTQEETAEQEMRPEEVQRLPMKRAARPDEIAKLALYLASPDADYCSGATFTIDGALGQHMAQEA